MLCNEIRLNNEMGRYGNNCSDQYGEQDPWTFMELYSFSRECGVSASCGTSEALAVRGVLCSSSVGGRHRRCRHQNVLFGDEIGIQIASLADLCSLPIALQVSWSCN